MLVGRSCRLAKCWTRRGRDQASARRRRRGRDLWPSGALQSSDVCAKVSSSRESAFAARRASPSAAARTSWDSVSTSK